MGEFTETLKRYRSRIGLRDATTAITSASIVIVLALIAFAFQSNSDDVDKASGATDITDPTDDLPAATDGAVAGASAKPGASGVPGGGVGPTSSGAVTAPEKVPPNVALTKEVIKIGVAYLEDPGTANAAAGFGGVGQVDQKRAIDTMIKEINKNPPYGRKAVPVYYSFTTDDVTSKGAERIAQEACAKWTQDNKVFMAWSGGSDNTLNSCLNKAGVVQLGGGGGLSWSKTYKDYPLLVEPGDAGLDRLAQFEVDQLFKQRFFSEFKQNSPPYTPQKPADGKARIGLIRYDQPSYDAASAAMKKALASHGLSICSKCEFRVAYSSDDIPEQLDDANEVNIAIQNCKARTEGTGPNRHAAPCTHMLFLGSTAGLRIPLFFVDGAEKQAYRPRIGFNPLDAPTVVYDFLGPAADAQFRDSMIVADGPSQFRVKTPAFKKCKAIFEKAGETFTGSEASNKEAQIPGFCDIAWYFIAAMLKAGPTLTTDSWIRGVESVSPVESASVYRMQTKRGRHDGSSGIRVGAWTQDCRCFKPKTGIVLV